MSSGENGDVRHAFGAFYAAGPPIGLELSSETQVWRGDSKSSLRANDVCEESRRLFKGLGTSKTAPRFRASVLHAGSFFMEPKPKQALSSSPGVIRTQQIIACTHIFRGCNDFAVTCATKRASRTDCPGGRSAARRDATKNDARHAATRRRRDDARRSVERHGAAGPRGARACARL